MHGAIRASRAALRALAVMLALSASVGAGALVDAANPPAFGGASVKSVRVGTFDDHTRVVLTTNAPVQPRLFTLSAPDRLIIDLPEIGWDVRRPAGNVESRLVRRYRFGLFEPGVSRLVLNLSGPARVEGVQMRAVGTNGLFEYDVRLSEHVPSRLPRDLIARAEEQGAERLPVAPMIGKADREKRRGLSFDPGQADFGSLSDVLAGLGKQPEQKMPAEGAPLKAEEPEHADVGAEDSVLAMVRSLFDPSDATVSAAASGPEVDAVPETTRPEAKPLAKEESPAIVMRPVRIVIDPGHGGRDPGAVHDATDTHEKNVVLAFSHDLLELLEADPAYEVSATRLDDTFVPLPDRVTFAKAFGADLMVSIHADSFHDPSIAGATAYTLSEEASLRTTEKLARERDAEKEVAGVEIGKERDDVVRVLLDLSRRETQSRSRRFAELVTTELETVTPVVRGHRRHDLHVLRTLDLPAVLIELGYMSNAEDRTRLGSAEWRLQTARAVKSALDRWRVERGTREFARR